MERQSEALSVTPPALVPSIAAGFSAISNRIHLIALPVLLDLFLWLGPRYRLKSLVTPWFDQSLAAVRDLTTAETSAYLNAASEMWTALLDRFNLFSLVRTFPIGIPSLMVAEGNLESPLGKTATLEATSVGIALLAVLVIFLIGTIVGSAFFAQVARATSEKKISLSFGELGRLSMQSLALALVLLGVMLAFSVPGSILVGVFIWINPALAQLAMILLFIVLLWFMVPLLFSPHGIFVNRQTVLLSIFTSVRLVRYYLPATGLFLLTLILMGQGLDLLWRIPPANSWMTLVGIAGHAFVSTSLLAATFAYYRGGMEWMQANVRRQALNARS